MAHNVVKPHILEADLLHSLLEVSVVEHFQGISVDEEHRVSLDFSVTRLNKALISGLLSSLVAVEAKSFDPLKFILPLLTDHFKKTFWRNVFASVDSSHRLVDLFRCSIADFTLCCIIIAFER